MDRSPVVVKPRGRVTLPAETLRGLGLVAGSLLEVTVQGDGIRLRPVRSFAEDSWAHTAESLRSVKRSIADVKAGRVYRMSTEEIARSRLSRNADTRSASR